MNRNVESLLRDVRRWIQGLANYREQPALLSLLERINDALGDEEV